MLVLDRIFPENHPHPSEFFVGKNVVHLPTVKCHIYTTTTGAMKNAFGGLLGTRRHYTHSWIHETLVDLLAIQQEIHPGIFAVMDGTLCGDGPGHGLLDRSSGPAAQRRPKWQSTPCQAHGLIPSRFCAPSLTSVVWASATPREIELVGDDMSGVNLHFSVGRNTAAWAGSAIWTDPLHPLSGASSSIRRW